MTNVMLRDTAWAESRAPATPSNSIQVVGDDAYFRLSRGTLRDKSWRAELSGRTNPLTRQMLRGTEYQVRFGLRTPPDWRPDNTEEIIWGLYQADPAGPLSQGRLHIASLRVNGRRFALRFTYSNGCRPGVIVQHATSQKFGRLRADKTVEIEIRVSLSTAPDAPGYLEVYLDGARQFRRLGPLGPSAGPETNMAFGICKPMWDPSHLRGPTKTDVREYGFIGFSVVCLGQRSGVVVPAHHAIQRAAEVPSTP